MIPFLDLKAPHEELRMEIMAALSRVVDSGWYVLGEEVESFEAQFAAYCSAAHCVGVANGLDALHLTLRALGVGPGDEVIVPSNTYIATWLAVEPVRRDAGAGRARRGHLQHRPRSASRRRSRRAPGSSCRCTCTASRPSWTRSSPSPAGTA